jgi:deoxyribonuclease V
MSLLDSSLEKRLDEVQRIVASRVVLKDEFSCEAVAGVDQAFIGDLVISGAVVLGPDGDVMGTAHHAIKASLPYVPGYLSFREGPAAIKAVRALHPRPSLLFVDGCGINHPRMAGLASYVGVTLDLPTIGVSKSVLCGSFDLPERVGEAKPLVYDGTLVGYMLKSKKGCRPIVAAPGHKISVDSALEMTRRWINGQKLPEPCRLAHEHANRVKMGRIQSPAPAISSLSPGPSQNPPDLFGKPLGGRAR